MTDFLVSYPRSGNSWLRYCVEYLTGQPTTSLVVNKAEQNNIPKTDSIGFGVIKHLDINKPAVLVKRHHFYCTWEDGIKYVCNCNLCQYRLNNTDRMLLLVRDYREAVFRHIMPQMGPDMKDQHMIDNLNRYMDVLYVYDKFGGSKTIVYYEDLISNPIGELSKLCNFFIFDLTRLQELANNLESHKAISLTKYGDSKTGGDKKRFHYSNVDKRLLNLLMDTAKNKHKEIVGKYLQRYK